MKLVKIKKLPQAKKGMFIKDNTGLGTNLYNQPLEMQLSGMNPIVGGPVPVIAQDQSGQRAYIPAGAQAPTMMYGKVKETPMMKEGGVLNHGIPYYNNHLKNVFSKDEPASMDDSSEKDIASSLTAVDEEEANVEAEKDELVLKPDLMGLYKVRGKTHKQGGTPLSLEEGSFIFSNDPNLAVDKEEAELFDFEELKSKSRKLNTPAKVLEREVDPEEYNTLVATMSDKDKDKIAKTTAAMMLQKYQEKIGRVAFIQESKKNDPIPPFAMGTAPMMYDKDKIEEEEDMYAKQGGLYKAQRGLNWQELIKPYIDEPKRKKRTLPPIYEGAQTPEGTYTDTGRNSRFDFPYGDPRDLSPEKLANSWKTVGIDITKMTPEQAQNAMYDWQLNQGDPGVLQTMWADWGMTRHGKKLGLNVDDTSVGNLGNLKKGYSDNLFGGRQWTPVHKRTSSYGPQGAPIGTMGSIPQPGLPAQPAAPGAAPATPENIPSLGYDIKGKLTDSQLAHLGVMGLNAMGIKKYYPKREQVDLPEVNLDLINEQPYINDINNQSFQAYGATSSGDPRLGRINAGNIYGRGLDAISKTRGNIQNQNTQIQNQENLTNLGQRTNQVMQNAQFDDRYYDQVQTTRENFDKEKRYANNALFSTLNQYQSQADQLAWGLASVNKYGRRLVVDQKTGKKYYQPVPLFEATGKGIRYNADVADLNLATGADKVNSSQEIKAMLEELGIDPNNYKNLQAMGTFMRAMAQMKQPFYGTNPLSPDR